MKVPVKVHGLIAHFPSGTIEHHLTALYTVVEKQYGGKSHGKFKEVTKNEPLYWESERYVNHRATGFGAILWTDARNPFVDIEIDILDPSRKPMVRDLEIPLNMKSSPKFLVDGKERFYFYEALEACRRSYFGAVKLPTGCLRSTTRIKLLDGSSPEIKDLVNRDPFWVMSVNSEGLVVPKIARNCHVTRKSRLYRLVLDDDSCIDLTGDHLLLNTRGKYVEAKDSLNDSICSTSFTIRDDERGYWFDREILTHPSGKIEPTHMSVAYFFNKKYEGSVVHHKDGNYRNNNPENLEVMTQSKHASIHGSELWSDTDYQSYIQSKRKTWLSTEEGIKYTKNNSDRLKEFNKVHPKKRDDISFKSLLEYSNLITSKVDLALAVDCSAQRISNILKKEGMTWREFAQKYCPNLNQYSRGHNHLVVSVIDLGFEEYVYDLEVEDLHNFMVDLGNDTAICVHNSGKSEIEITLGLNQSRQYGQGILIVPTNQIHQDLIKRCDKYEVSVMDYREGLKLVESEAYNPEDLCQFFISTPKVLTNDIRSGITSVISCMNWIMFDEVHHVNAPSWLEIVKGMPKASRIHGFSALPVSEETEYASTFRTLSYNDALTISLTGPIIYEKSASDLPEFLNLPILINIEFKWDRSKFEDADSLDWHTVYKQMKYYKERNDLIRDILVVLREHGRLFYAHVFQKETGLHWLELSGDDSLVCWYGGSTIHSYNNETEISVQDLKDNFGDKYKGVFVTSHAIEGLDFDVPIDTVLLSEGKSRRQSIQKVGRALRPSNTKSIIVNLFDVGSKIPRRHAEERANTVLREAAISEWYVRSIDELDNLLGTIERNELSYFKDLV